MYLPTTAEYIVTNDLSQSSLKAMNLNIKPDGKLKNFTLALNN